jgi:hypothetical protein
MIRPPQNALLCVKAALFEKNKKGGAETPPF